MQHENYEYLAAVSLDGTTTTHDIPVAGYSLVVIECTVDSTFTVKTQLLSRSGATARTCVCYFQDGNTGPVPQAPNTTITLTAGDKLWIHCAGESYVRIARQGGSGTYNPARIARGGEMLALGHLGLTGITTTIGAGTAQIGSVGIRPETRVIDTTLVVDTAIYANGDLLSDSIAIAAARANDINALLIGLLLNDKSDNPGIACVVYFLSANQSMGTINGAPNISDANADKILGFVTIAAADWVDVGGSKQVVLSKSQLPVLCKPASGTQNVYMAIVNTTGTPTYGTASDLTARTSWQDCLA